MPLIKISFQVQICKIKTTEQGGNMYQIARFKTNKILK